MVSILPIVARWLDVPHLVGEYVSDFTCSGCRSRERAWRAQGPEHEGETIRG
jgi:hypothetical protein